MRKTKKFVEKVLAFHIKENASVEKTATAFRLNKYTLYGWIRENRKTGNEAHSTLNVRRRVSPLKLEEHFQKPPGENYRYYEDKFIEEVVDFYIREKTTVKAVAEKFKVKESSVYRWVREKKQTANKKYKAPVIKAEPLEEGSKKPSRKGKKIINIENLKSPYSKKWRKLDPEQLVEYIKKNPNLTYKDYAEHFGVTHATISLSLKNIVLHKYYIENKNKEIIKGSSTEIDLEKIIVYVRENPGFRIIDYAAYFGVSCYTMRKHLRRLNIKKKWRKIDPERLLACVKENPQLTYKEYAAYFGVTRATVYKNLKKLGIKRPKIIKVDLDKLLAYVRENPQLAYREYAAYFGVNKNTIYKNLKKLGVKRKVKK